MNPHRTCETCVWNVDAHCACEDGTYKGSPVRSWNTCSTHKAPTPTPAELVERLTTCGWALDHLAQKAVGDYKAYFGDRAAQCRKWLDDVKEGQAADLDYITGGLQEFEAIALWLRHTAILLGVEPGKPTRERRRTPATAVRFEHAGGTGGRGVSFGKTPCLRGAINV